MSYVKKLELRGIRSYGPDKATFIDFPRPVTLILGHNGSGKTTIIEALKFACTGDTPSGNKGHFVFSPKLNDEYEIKGQVKLEFVDILKKASLVSRTLHTQQKAKTVSTKTLDGTIKRKSRDADGKETIESISMRCADLDTEMIRSLGVGSSVLNNVIFCHQEDSLWPLSEGSTVKKKFDEIFGQKRQTKCVDELRKKCKEIKDQNKVAKVDLQHLQNNQQKAAELEEELDRVEVKVAAGAMEVDQIDKELKELREKLDKSHEKVEEVRQLERKRDECSTRLESVESAKNRLAREVKTEFPQPTEKLLQMLSSFEQELQDKRKREHELTMKHSDVILSHDKSEENMQRFSMDIGRLEEAQKLYANLREEHSKMINKLAKSFQDNSLLLMGQKVVVDQECNVIQWVEAKMDESNRREERRIADTRAEMNKLSKNIDGVKTTIYKAQEELRIKTESRKKLKEEMDKLLIEINGIKTSGQSLSRIENDIVAVEEDIAEFEKTSRLEEIKTKLQSTGDEMQSVAAKQDKISGELELLHSENRDRQDRERAQQELGVKNAEVDKLLSTHKDTLIRHLGKLPEQGKHTATLTKYLNNRKIKGKELAARLTKTQRALAQKEHELKTAKQQMSELESKARTIRDQIVNVCSTPAIYENEVKTAENEYQRLKKENSNLVGITTVWQKVKDQIKETHSCPMCKSHLDDNSTSRAVESLGRKIAKAPERAIQSKENEAAAEKRYVALKAAAPLYDQLNELERDKIPELSELVTSLAEQIAEERQVVEDMEEDVQVEASEEFEARSMERDLDYVDRLQAECSNLRENIAKLSARLTCSYTKTLKEAISEQAGYQEEYKRLQEEQTRLAASKSKKEAMQLSLQKKLLGLKEEHAALNTQLQGLKGLEERRKEKALEIGELSKAERSVGETIQPAQVKLDSLEADWVKLQDSDQKTQREIRDALNTLSLDVQNARKLEQRLANSRGMDGSDLASLTEKLERCKSEYENLKIQKKKLESELQQVKRDLDSSQVQKRDLEDSLQIRKYEQDMEGIKSEISTIEKQLSDKGVATARKEAAKLQNAIEEKRQFKAGQEGRNKGLSDQISRLQRELNSDMFKDARVKYHHGLIEYTVGMKSAKDLEKYILSFERAIMHFHKSKMEEINRSLRSLWVQVYRGGDIDFIEISTDDDFSAETVSRRKTCNYRVVMNKGGVMIDMRQHSSAGQRVLAALLIRLALAETFCGNCGIITLDEPTTNLDKDNIQSLAVALSNFIKGREKSGSFQLVVITHDEDFVELLGRTAHIPYYFKVSKDHNQQSTITRKNMDA